MVIFHSYVSLPEGMLNNQRVYGLVLVGLPPQSDPSSVPKRSELDPVRQCPRYIYANVKGGDGGAFLKGSY